MKCADEIQTAFIINYDCESVLNNQVIMLKISHRIKKKN